VHRFATTGDAEDFAAAGSRVLGRAIERVQPVELGELEALHVPEAEGEGR
jgi:hypothetical protein